MDTASLVKAMPYAGTLYLATSPALQKYGLLKFGHTQRTARQRATEMPGVLSLEKASVVFEFPCDDSFSAEQLARAYFETRGMLVQERRELIHCEVRQASRLLRMAAKKARVRQAVAVATPAARVLTSANKAWASLLEHELTKGDDHKQLGAWLSDSLDSASVRRWLERKGILCSNWDRAEPQFQFEYLDEFMLNWLKRTRFKVSALQSAEFKGQFVVDCHYKSGKI
jgi:hypothetical protein